TRSKRDWSSDVCSSDLHAVGALAPEPRRRTGHRELRPELLGLNESLAGELLTRNAGREAQVVLDARARAGLPARRAGLDHQHVEIGRASCRERVEGGGG